MVDSSAKIRLEVVNPVAEVRPDAVLPARRLDSLDGKKIALWWNSKPHGDAALDTVAEAFQQRFENVSFVRFSQQYDWGRHFPERYDEIKASGCDAVIATNAD